MNKIHDNSDLAVLTLNNPLNGRYQFNLICKESSTTIQRLVSLFAQAQGLDPYQVRFTLETSN